MGAGNDIVVTARRGEETIQDVPQVVNAVTADTIAKLNIRSLQDIQSVVPGLELTAGTNGIGQVTTIRGVAFDANQNGNRGYEGYLRADAATVAERLSAAGYRTLMAGKWHLGVTPEQDPHARGFQHSFAMLDCCHNHFGVGLSVDRTKMSAYTRDGQVVTSLPADFYSSDFFAAQLIDQLNASRQGADGAKPFFAYLAFTAPHAPLQAPSATIAKYAGRYDAGYDVLRETRLKRQRELGLVDPAVQPHHPVDTVPWNSLTPDKKRASARKMEIYAAMVDRLDQAVGRVVAALKANREYDNTVIFFLSDNGGSARRTRL